MVVVWQISVVVYDTKTIVSGVIIKTKRAKQKDKDSLLANLFHLIKSYVRPPLKNVDLTVNINKQKYHTTTNNSGAFSFTLNFALESLTELNIYYKDNKLVIHQDYPVFFEKTPSNISVISDIDDTIIISYTASIFKRVATAALVVPHKRKIIDFTNRAISFLNKNNARVYYVSKSESNLFGILSSYILHTKLPKGQLFLTPYLSFAELLKGKKGKDYKLNTIKFILENLANKQFILLGDDTQKDMDVYNNIAEQFPDKIARIYIRQTRRTISTEQQKKWESLKNTCPNSVYFNAETDIEQELLILEDLL